MSQPNIKKQLNYIEENFHSKLIHDWTNWDAILFAIIAKQVQAQEGQPDNYAFSLDGLLSKALSVKKLDLTYPQFEKIKGFIFLNLKTLNMSDNAFKNLLADYLIYLEAKQGLLNSFQVKHLPHNELINEIEQKAQAFIKKFEQDYEYQDIIIRLNLEDIVIAYALYQLQLIKQSTLAAQEKKSLGCQIKQQLVEQGFTKPSKLRQYLHIAEEAIAWGLSITLLVTALLFFMAYFHMPFVFFNLIGVTMIGVVVFAVGGYALADLKRDDIALAYQRIDELIENIVANQSNSLVGTPLILVADEQQPNDIQGSNLLNKTGDMHYVQQAKELLGEVEVNRAQARPSTSYEACQPR